jgi:hypothetical protein
MKRNLITNGLSLLAAGAAALMCAVVPALAADNKPNAIKTDPLPSWNDGMAKQAIVNFVRVTTDQTGTKFVPPEERIATFDQDGTLWVEHPIYTQVVYCLDRVPALVAEKPELKDIEPFKTVLSGDHEAIAKLTLPELEKILFATLTGITADEFQAEVKKWIAIAKHARYDRIYTELVYQPMLEVMEYLGATEKIN